MFNSKSFRFFAVEKITFIYIAITSIIILFVMPNNVAELFGSRALIIATIFVMTYLNSLKNWWIIKLTRYAFIGALLSFFYPDTFDINRTLPNHDHIFAALEQTIFNCQPALLFSKAFPQFWVREFLNFGYWAYFPLIVGTSLFLFFWGKRHFENFFFVVICSFYIFYIAYSIFPVVGPQYYFPAIGIENVKSGIFPAVGQYFNDHSVLIKTMHPDGLFSNMVIKTQSVGERPTAAFPSSHVGISTLIIFMLLRFRKFGAVATIAPIYIALVLATVYIEAHYLIDVIAGFLSAILLYFVSNHLYELFTRRYSGLNEMSSLFLKSKNWVESLNLKQEKLPD